MTVDALPGPWGTAQGLFGGVLGGDFCTPCVNCLSLAALQASLAKLLHRCQLLLPSRLNWLLRENFTVQCVFNLDLTQVALTNACLWIPFYWTMIERCAQR